MPSIHVQETKHTLDEFKNLLDPQNKESYVSIDSDKDHKPLTVKAPKSLWQRFIGWLSGESEREKVFHKAVIQSFRDVINTEFTSDLMKNVDERLDEMHDEGKPLKAFMIQEILTSAEELKDKKITEYAESFVEKQTTGYTNVEKQTLVGQIKDALKNIKLSELKEKGKPIAEEQLKQFNSARNPKAAESQPVYGLQNLGSGSQPADIVHGTGKKYTPGEKVGRYTVVKEKEKGVEPGFIGTKNWSDKDEAKLMNEAKEGEEPHKFYSRAWNIIDVKLLEEGSEGNIYQKAALAYIKEDAGARETPQDRIASFLENNPSEETNLFNAIKNNQSCHDAIVEDIMTGGFTSEVKNKIIEDKLTTDWSEVNEIVEKELFPDNREPLQVQGVSVYEKAALAFINKHINLATRDGDRSRSYPGLTMQDFQRSPSAFFKKFLETFPNENDKKALFAAIRNDAECQKDLNSRGAAISAQTGSKNLNVYQKAALSFIHDKIDYSDAKNKEAGLTVELLQASPRTFFETFLQTYPNDKEALFEAVQNDADCQKDLNNRGIAIQRDAITRKFMTFHYVKLDYKEADIGKSLLGEKLTFIPKDRANNIIHLHTSAATPRQRNLDAMRECLANDIMKLLGARTQKLKLVLSEYEDKSPKLLLDGTHFMRPNGEAFDDFGRKQDDPKFKRGIVDGCLVKKGPGNKLVSDDTLNAKGRHKIFFLLASDRDAVGKRGDNKGFAGDDVAVIDPGKSFISGGGLFTQDLMDFENIHTDFSFEESKKWVDQINGGFVNFSIFDDDSFSEKMQGVRMMRDIKASGKDTAVFDEYMATFDGSKNPDLNFKKEIEAVKNAYIKRRDYILGVFEKRMQFIDEPKVLDALDGLEKATSVTSNTSPNEGIPLNYPRVIKRQEWHIAKDESGNYVFSTQGGDLDNMEKDILEKLKLKPSETGLIRVEQKKDSKELLVVVEKSRIDHFYEKMNPKINRAART